MLGQNIDPNFQGTVAPWFGTILLVLFMMTMMILMLNLLIALMGDAFSKVRQQGLALWRLEQASIILEQHFSFSLLPHLWACCGTSCMTWILTSMASFFKSQTAYPPYLHVLKYSSDVYTGPTDGMLRLSELVEAGRHQATRFTPFVVEVIDRKAEEQKIEREIFQEPRRHRDVAISFTRETSTKVK